MLTYCRLAANSAPICALMAFSAIKIVRNVAAFNLPKMIEELKHARELGETHWYDSLVEIGASVNTVNLTTMLVPGREPYWYGRSYLQAIVHIVPYMSGVLESYLGASPSWWLTRAATVCSSIPGWASSVWCWPCQTMRS